MNYLVIIPAYNEEKNVPDLIAKIKETGYDYLVINDCSTDNSSLVYDKLDISFLDLPINMGLASVTQAGFRYAYDHGYDGAIVIDGDGQHPPKYIKTVLDELDKGYNYVVGSRYLKEKKPWTLRMVGSRIICFFIYLKTGKKVTDPTSGMRAADKNIMKLFADNMNYIAEPDAYADLIKRKFKTAEVQVYMEEREAGVSYFSNPLKSIRFVFNVLVSILFL